MYACVLIQGLTELSNLFSNLWDPPACLLKSWNYRSTPLHLAPDFVFKIEGRGKQMVLETWSHHTQQQAMSSQVTKHNLEKDWPRGLCLEPLFIKI